MSDVVSHFFRFILKLVLGLFAALFAASLLAATLVLLALSLLKSLITGRRPAPAMVFGRLQPFSQPGFWPGHHAREVPPRNNAGQVVDVEVREIHEGKHLS